jgi:hypothetical protein
MLPPALVSWHTRAGWPPLSYAEILGLRRAPHHRTQTPEQCPRLSLDEAFEAERLGHDLLLLSRFSHEPERFVHLGRWIHGEDETLPSVAESLELHAEVCLFRPWTSCPIGVGGSAMPGSVKPSRRRGGSIRSETHYTFRAVVA